MAAFSFQHYPFHLDSVFLPIKTLSPFMEDPNPNHLSQFYPPELLNITETQPPSLLDQCSLGVSDNEPSSVTKKQSTDSSSVMDNKLENGEQVTQQWNNYNNKRKKTNNSNTSSSNSPAKDEREGRSSKKQRKSSNEKKEEEKKPKAKKKGSEEEAPSGYIHVRARRGQATDSHSLAERVRREKISERMKILQRLVPGCDKVTGKALMLDEIINYVQSLQNQVEFLSMKLASVNPLFYDYGMDLDALTLRPDQGLSNYTPSISQQSTPIPPMVFADATTVTPVTNSTTVAFTATTNSYQPVIDASASLLLQCIQENGGLIWDVDEQRQKFLNQSGLVNHSLCSFH